MNILSRLFSKTQTKKKNQINVIRPYLWHFMWVFDDKSVGLVKEPFVAGVPDMIEVALQQSGIKDAHEKGFVALFSDEPFYGYKFVLDFYKEETNGTIYRYTYMLDGKSITVEGWFCRALNRYYPSSPRHLYVQLKAA